MPELALAGKSRAISLVPGQVDASVPLFGYIGRLEEQKGVDILIAALPKALQNSNIQVAILGTGNSNTFGRIWTALRFVMAFAL